MQTRTTYSAPTYRLGTLVGGRAYLFTGLGEFRSALEATGYAKRQARNGVWYVFEEREVSRLGVVFGSTSEIVATVQG